MPDTPPVVAVLDDDEHATALRAELADALPGVPVEAVADAAASDRLADTAVVATQSFDDALLDAGVPWLHALSAGVDHYPLDRLRDVGVAFTNASGVHAEPAAEQVLAYLLAFERNLHRAVRHQERREWERYRGTELRGRTVGVVGLGAIGGRVAELASALGTRVVGTKRNPGTAPDAVDEAHPPDALPRVLDRADYVVLACPLTDDTRGLVGPDEFAAMRDDAVLVNVARGEVVQEDALIAALRDDAIAGAALDVFAAEPLPEGSPLWGIEDVIVTPHVAGSTPAYWARNAALLAGNYERFVADGPGALDNRVV
jgi:phosphoglycerate dehydrogenase-like enzyme